MDPSQDKKSSIKLAQLQQALWEGCSDEILEKISRKEGDINFVNPSDAQPNRSGYTALHLASLHDRKALFMSMLSCGADFTLKNAKGETALHMWIPKQCVIMELLDNPCVKAVLTAHVNTKNVSNPCDNDGLSHFHIACMTSHSATAVKFFIDNGVSVNQPISMDSKSLPGYTPLHLAVIYLNTEVVELLIAYGANIDITDKKGMTPLHHLIERRLQMYDSIMYAFVAKLKKKVVENEKIINLLLVNISNDNHRLDSTNLSNFHVACLLQDTLTIQNLANERMDIDHCVNMDSPLCPGYTALHFAAHDSLKTVEILVNKGANLAAEDLKGKTPLDICFEKKYRIDKVCDIMSLNTNIKNILFSDGRTNLLLFLRSYIHVNSLKKFLNCSVQDINIFIQMSSTLWPGYTPLHLAVRFARIRNTDKKDLQIIQLCLQSGADLRIQDSQGQTALHLAFRLGKMEVVDEIFQHSRQIPNVADEDNLSHLHIACASSKRKSQLTKFVLNNEEVNRVCKAALPIGIVMPGSTPLHISIMNTDGQDDIRDVIKILLDNGADVNVKDAYGLTPIHWLLKYSGNGREDLLNERTRDCVAENYGLSYLHVACHLRDHEAVKYFVENGSDVNLVIRYNQRADDDPLAFLSEYDKYTPSYFSTLCVPETRKLLLEHGADVLAQETFLFKEYISQVCSKMTLQIRMEREFGWTRLHLACYLLELDGFEDLVEVELRNINARVRSNSPVWKGCTPLHLLMHCQQDCDIMADRRNNMLKMLLEKGADVNLTEDQQETPITMLTKRFCDIEARQQATMLMKYQRNFSVNPSNTHGVSHFHLACYLNDANAVARFLSCGNVDVNSPIDFFSNWHPGCTSLHLTSQLRIITVLLNHGADKYIEDVEGCTLLHNAVKANMFDVNIIMKIIESGVNVNRPNFKGETPFEIAISEDEISMEKLTFFITHGFHVNSVNLVTGVGYVSLILQMHYRDDILKQLIIDKIMEENSSNALGRTMLHHWVTVPQPPKAPSIVDYINGLRNLTRLKENFEHLDNQGKSALHLAVQFKNKVAVEELLAAGFDINALNVNGRSALSLVSARAASVDSDRKLIRGVLIRHACRLTLLNLHLNTIDTAVICNFKQLIRDDAFDYRFREQIDMCKEIQLGEKGPPYLYHFLCKTDVVELYPFLQPRDREIIDRYFFEIIDNVDRLKDVRGFLKLQFRKALKRLNVLSLSSINAFKSISRVNFPPVCVKNIIQYFGKSDLENIERAAMGNVDVAMEVD